MCPSCRIVLLPESQSLFWCSILWLTSEALRMLAGFHACTVLVLPDGVIRSLLTYDSRFFLKWLFSGLTEMARNGSYLSAHHQNSYHTTTQPTVIKILCVKDYEVSTFRSVYVHILITKVCISKTWHSHILHQAERRKIILFNFNPGD